jgi:hypothetical protein
MNFDEIIIKQREARSHYKSGERGHGEIVSIMISDNKILSIKGGEKSYRTKQYSKLIENTLKKHKLKDCHVNININDVPRNGYFNFSRELNVSCQFLLPNHRFTLDDIKIDKHNTKFANFDEQSKFIRSKQSNFDKKISKIFTSCLPQVNKIDYFKYALMGNNRDFCDGYLWIGSPHGNIQADSTIIKELGAYGMVGKKFIPFLRNSYYKYLLYNDGFSLSDRMRLLLCINSVVIRKNSPFEEFYTYKLKPYVNFIEYEHNSELEHIYAHLQADEGFCNEIIQNNEKFIDEVLNYDNILKYTADVINAVC